jgi:uncharacterized protein YndB with AHSA1/START domain
MIMPSFVLSTRSSAPVEEVWKLLHDPALFPRWWTGIETVVVGDAGAYTMWPAGYPDFPMAQQLQSEPAGRRVTISCLVSDLEFCWQLREAGSGTDIDVAVALPEREAHRLDSQRQVVAASIERLAALAENDHVD